VGHSFPVNAGAIPGELIGSTLFGHEKGAFTGALGASSGLFNVADGGTLFSDEIETMDEHTQINLLRALESKRYQPSAQPSFFPRACGFWRQPTRI
jgi:transcriptional regulator with PAS, ATPase and Fis domain